jgi:hypothetical protein
MAAKRIIYFVLIGVIIVLGLLSRRFTFIPLCAGDVLWATMIYFIFRFFLLNATIPKITLISLILSYSIEFSQLYKATWIDNLRHTFAGRMILGETFSWGDLLSYTAGIMIAIVIDVAIRRSKSN